MEKLPEDEMLRAQKLVIAVQTSRIRALETMVRALCDSIDLGMTSMVDTGLVRDSLKTVEVPRAQ
jgi:hypothetical protein